MRLCIPSVVLALPPRYSAVFPLLDFSTILTSARHFRNCNKNQLLADQGRRGFPAHSTLDKGLHVKFDSYG
ncbi:MAG: hypothetical protein HW407_744 [Bacteroidetes bacterium]|nr:hypothetical protein [Bacteroidota bacterium]